MADLESERAAEAVIERGSDPDGTPVVAVSGEVDISNAGKLEAAVGAIAKSGPECLVLDLRGLRFMDSAGIAVLIGATEKIKTVKLRAPSPAVTRVVELTGLTDVFAIEP
jgi:anti-sigma B factor antagonist